MTLLPASNRPLTLEETFSFYVSGRDRERIRDCAQDADAVVVCGAQGPASVQRLRQDGWQDREDGFPVGGNWFLACDENR